MPRGGNQYGPPKGCAVEDCEGVHFGRGWCRKHYTRWLRHGDPTVTAMGTHGFSRHVLYPTWSGMVKRCTWPEYHNYRWYGARGITVHEPWLTDPAAFITWVEANLGERPDGHTIDRIDNDGNYEPGNLRWATATQQVANQRKAEHVHAG